MALIFLGSALLFGAAAVRRLGLSLHRFEAVALAVVVGLFGWTWLAFLLALLLPYDLALGLTVLLTLGGSVALWLGRRPVEWLPLPGGRTGLLVWAGATVVTTIGFAVLFWTHSLLPDDTGVYSAGSTWADFGLHAAIVSHLAVPDSMPLDLPVASGASLTYPFLIDLLSALYVRGGWGLHAAFGVPGFLLAVGICQLLMAFALRLFSSVGAAVLGLALVLFIGSAVGLPTAIADFLAGEQTLAAFLGDLPRDYTTLSDLNGSVTNIVAHALLPQRAFLFGLGVALAVFILFHAGRETGERRYLVAGAVLVGLLPMAHPHSFVASGAVLAALAVEAAVRERRIPWTHLGAGSLALLLAVPQLAWQQRGNPGGTGGRFRFGWELGPGESVWAYWWANFGLMGLLFVALPFLLLLRRDLRKYLVWYLPMLVLLGVTQVYAFQPFEYDNLKLIYYAYLMGGLLLAYLAVDAVRTRRVALVGVVPLVAVIITPGVLSVVHEFQLRDQFASSADVALADWVRADTAPDAVFLTTDRPNQPIATLGGRAIVMGYRGWLYNFNVPYAEREAAVGAALEGRVDDPAVQRFGADYLAVATNEDASFTVDRGRLAALPVAYENSEWTIYRVDSGAAPADAG